MTNGQLVIDKSLTIDGPGANSLIVRRSAAAGWQSSQKSSRIKSAADGRLPIL